MNLKALIALLSPASREALEAAVAGAMSRTHYDADVEHWLLRLVERNDADLHAVLAHFEVDDGRLTAELNRALDRLRTGNARPPALSPRIVRLVRDAWLFASVEQGEGAIRPSHLLAALVAERDLGGAIREAAPQLAKVDADVLAKNFPAIAGEGREAGAPAAAGEAAPAAPLPPGGRGKALDTYCVDLTAQARDGRIDPVIGRDDEIRQVIDILTRRRQNNPVLTGEAGVGKTAVVEGFALRIVAGEVPEALRAVRLLSLDLGLLQAGAGVRGEFENRLKQVIEEAKASPVPVVMFIDEAHSLVGAGGQEGQGDAANLLKPALARGELRTVAATTWAEYKKYFEKDAALTRRFQVVKVDEPDEAKAIAMMRGLVATLEGHHRVRILDEAVVAAVRLSHRYIFGRQLPDKSISLLDTASARVAMSQSATPAAIEDAGRRIDALTVERGMLAREAAGGGEHAARLAEIDGALAAAGEERDRLAERFAQEKALADEIAALRLRLEGEETGDEVRAEFDAKRAALAELQGERPMVFQVVDRHAVADVVALWTGIPVGRMVADELRSVLDLEAELGARIRGQDPALHEIGNAIRTSRAGLTDPRKPTGVFLMVGLSGTGKTETALALADMFYGGPQNLTVINMSEFKEEHKVSMLLGAPPGYVGYGEGGVLTEAVRRKPFSVVLLDEMEKAHPGVQDVFYQLFDKGIIKDGQGRDVDFRHSLLVMTSNAGSDLIEKLFSDPDLAPDAAGLAEALRPELLKHFKPAFLGRVTVVPYFPLSPAVLREIIGLALGRLAARVRDTYAAELGWDEAVLDAIAARCTEAQSGARNVESVVARGIAPELASLLLQHRQDGTVTNRAELSAGAGNKIEIALS